MKKLLTLIAKISAGIFDSAYFILALAIIAAAAYFFGFNLLRNPTYGNDALNTLNYAVWINEHFPKVPLWWPGVGGGSSFMLGYPLLYPWSVVILHRLTNLNLFSSMAILNFASLLLPAWGVFVFVFFRFRLRIAALLSGLFYLLSPLAYVLISGAGFLAHAYAGIFAVPFLIFLDAYLADWIEKRSARRKLINLFFAGIFWVLAMLAHPVAVLGLMVLYGFYVVLAGLMVDGLKGLGRGILGMAIASAVLFLLIYFWYKPFSAYTAFSNRDLTFSADASVLPPVELEGTFGLSKRTPEHQYPFTNLSVVPFVWIMAGIGGVIGFLKFIFSRKSRTNEDTAVGQFVPVSHAARVFILGLLAFFSIYQTGTYTLWTLATKINWFLGSFFVNRYYYTSSMILPAIAAGIGVWYLASVPFAPILWSFKRFKSYLAFPFKSIVFLITLVLALGITGWGLLKLNQLSGFYEPQKPWMLHYGEEDGVDSRSIWNRPNPFDPCFYPQGHNKRSKYCDDSMVRRYVDVGLLIRMCEKDLQANSNEVICRGGTKVEPIGWVPVAEKDFQDFKARCSQAGYTGEPGYLPDLCLAFSPILEEQLKNWPQPLLPEDQTIAALHTASFAKPENPNYFLSQEETRIDITPSLGTWVKEWGINNRSSIVNAYTGQLILNKSFQSYFTDTIYSKDLVKIPVTVDEIARYFGIKGVIITGSNQTEKFEAQNWKRTTLKESGALWQPPFETNLYSLEAKPLVLVVGSLGRQAYQQVFRAATMGGLSFDQAILVEGRERLDSYSAKELTGFEMLILHGYTYRNRTKAFGMLEEYVRNGGRVFIDTGWQYVVPDWGKKDGKAVEFPAVIPVSQTDWTSADRGWEAVKLDQAFGEGVVLSDFDPLVWGDVPWNLAAAPLSGVCDWARPILTIGDRVIMAGGDFGGGPASAGGLRRGKVVWSGMNFISHARDSENPAEMKLMNNIFRFLLDTRDGDYVAATHPSTSSGQAASPNSEANFSYSREPDRLVVTFDREVPEGSSFYFRESFYPYWRAESVSGKKRESLPILTAGPRYMLVRLPQVSSGDQLIFSFKPDFSYLLARIISLITFILLIVLLFDSFFTRGRLLRWLEKRVSPLTTGLASHFLSRAKKIKEDFGKEEEY